jgi:signal transduction histidine kinase
VPQGVNLVIRDNGFGIDAESIPKVFEAFFTRSTIGTSIGLFVAKQFIQGLSGEITIESHQDSNAHGTNICIFVPLVTTHESS